MKIITDFFKRVNLFVPENANTSEDVLETVPRADGTDFLFDCDTAPFDETYDRNDPRNAIIAVSLPGGCECPFCGEEMKLACTRVRLADVMADPYGDAGNFWNIFALNDVERRNVDYSVFGRVCVLRMRFRIPVYRCPVCGKYHRALPSFMYPGIVCGMRLLADRARGKLPGGLTLYGTDEPYVVDERTERNAGVLLERIQRFFVDSRAGKESPAETLEEFVMDALKSHYAEDGKRLVRVRHGRTDWAGSDDVCEKLLKIFSRLPRLPSYHNTAVASVRRLGAV